MKTSNKLMLGAAGLAVAAAALAFVFQDSLYLSSIRPGHSMDSERTPARPDYAVAANWALRPETPPPGAWEKPWGIDVFFIHPTSAHGGGWNVAADMPKAMERLDETLMPVHARAFMGGGPVYAPRYRQAALYASVTTGQESKEALDLAYSDILRAFDHYMATDNRDRGVIIAGVGQGGAHAERLLKERFANEAVRRRLAAAYLIDAGIKTDAGLPAPFCNGPDDIQCVAAWTTHAAVNSLGLKAADQQKLACINPVSWNAAGALSPKSAHKGGAAAGASKAADPQSHAGEVTAQCAGGVLETSEPASGALREAGGWGSAYRPARVNLFFADIALNAGERARAASSWLDANEPKPAKPLPPVRDLPDAPIYREDGIIDRIEP
jgi:hypothetical protein